MATVVTTPKVGDFGGSGDGVWTREHLVGLARARRILGVFFTHLSTDQWIPW